MIGFNGGLIGLARPPAPGLSIPGVWTPREQEVAIRSSTWVATTLLDIHPGAASAYSLRLLRAAYINSPVVQVRNGSTNGLRNCTAAEVVDGTLATFCSGADGFVRTWYDQSGNDNHAAQTVDNAWQPKIIASGSLILNNGRPVVQFNGSSHTITQTVFTTIPQPFTVITVAKRNSDTGSNQNIFRSNGVEAVNFFNSGDSNNLYGFAGSAPKLGDTPIDTRFLSSVAYNGASSTNFFNGTQSTVDLGTGSLTSSTILSIGSNASPNSFASIDMPELIFYGSSQASNFASIATNINAFYGIY